MVEAAPRAYRSELRARQAQETRSRIVAASARLFATQGYQATTIAAIAREAGVSAETVKTTAAKAELLIAAFETTFSGSEGADSLADTEVAAGLLELPDEVFLDVVLTQITTANARGHGLWTVLLGAALSDPVVDAALHRILERRGADYRMLVSELRRRGIAAPGIDEATTADALSFLLSPESYQQLVAQSGWTTDRYAAWLRAAVDAEITATRLSPAD
ncbi:MULTISPECIES: TetR/AcrR family transcriptional regulator [unclassified Microbacterium]|uniref:TetR/AcrR family transcriptional regulator n=1 Tax=unclassified Microbacterium TaxID=2609290 RepID=UPI000CFE4A1E|nr:MULTISPECIES: TetR/AcrR family transcriptional regulator [unclassified Microbacterium]PRB57860.1 TetR family transcriptional regulator [Microbacterium sp. MYb45]